MYVAIYGAVICAFFLILRYHANQRVRDMYEAMTPEEKAHYWSFDPERYVADELESAA